MASLPPELWDRIFSYLPVSILITSVVRLSRTFHTLAWRQIGPRIVITEIPRRDDVHRVDFPRVFAHMHRFGVIPYIRALRRIKLVDTAPPGASLVTHLESLSRLELATITREEVPLLTHLTALQHLSIGTYHPPVLPPLLASLSRLQGLRHLTLPIRIAPEDHELSLGFVTSLTALKSLYLSHVTSKAMLAGLESLTGLRSLALTIADSMDFNPAAVANTVTNNVVVSTLNGLRGLRRLGFGSFIEGPDLRAIQLGLYEHTALTSLRLENVEPVAPATNVWHVLSHLGSTLAAVEIFECPLQEAVTAADLLHFSKLTALSWVDSNAGPGLLQNISVLSALRRVHLVNLDIHDNDLLLLTALRVLSSLDVSTHHAIHVPAILRMAGPLCSSLKRLRIHGQSLNATRMGHPTVLQHLTFLESLGLPLTRAEEEGDMAAELTHDEIVSLVRHYYHQPEGQRQVGIKRRHS